MATIHGTGASEALYAGTDPYNVIFAGAGDDIIFNGPGRSYVDGGSGFDTFVVDIGYGGGANLDFVNSQYLIGGAEGDRSVGVERIIFRDTVVLVDPQHGLEGAVALPFTEIAPINDALRAVLRVKAPDLLAERTALSIRAGELTFAGYVEALVASAGTSTVPALLMQAAIFGTVPTSEKLDPLALFARTQFDYYKNTLQSAFAELGPYEALGRGFAATAEFQAAFSGGTDPDFVEIAYAPLFNRSATAAQQDALLAQVSYFESLYRSAGLSESQAELEARGAVYGQMVGHAAQEPELGYGAAAASILVGLALGDNSAYGAVFGS